ILDITSRLYSKGFDIVFCWLPSHVGIIGNEQADSAAKSATTHLPLAVPLSDMKRVIMHHIFNIWQESWSQQLDNKLHSVKPVIAAWPVMPLRRTDVKLTRLRIGRLSFLEHCIQSEKEFPDLTDDDTLAGFQNEHDELSSLKEQDLGELALFLPCPVLDFPENEKNSKKRNDPPEPSFVSPKKTAKKLKLSHPIAGTSQPVSVQNKFSSLSEMDAEITPTTSNQTAAPISARPKVPPIMFKHKKANYKLIVKNLNKDFPDCDVKLAGKYLKIFCKSSDEHRIVTEYLKEKSEEFYVIDPPDSRPLKIVIKGLPISTEIG
ncbi:RNase H domain-containing protein, partial [Trichonephila clavipes]